MGFFDFLGSMNPSEPPKGDRNKNLSKRSDKALDDLVATGTSQKADEALDSLLHEGSLATADKQIAEAEAISKKVSPSNPDARIRESRIANLPLAIQKNREALDKILSEERPRLNPQGGSPATETGFYVPGDAKEMDSAQLRDFLGHYLSSPNANPEVSRLLGNIVRDEVQLEQIRPTEEKPLSNQENLSKMGALTPYEERQRQAALPQEAAISTPETEVTTSKYKQIMNGGKMADPQRVQTMLDIIEKHQLDTGQPVDFATGALQLIQDEFPDLLPHFVQYALKQQQEQQAQQQPTEGSAKAEIDASVKAADAMAQEKQAVITARRDDLKATQAELADAQELQSWPAIIAFVLLSMLIKPQGAFLFFSNARKKKELGFLIENIKSEIKQAQEDKQQAENERQQYRKMYVQSRLQGDRTDDARAKNFRNQLLLTRVRGEQAMQRAQTKQKDAVLEKLSGDLRDAMNMAGKFAASVDYDKSEEWNKRAEALIPLIQQRRSQLIPQPHK